MTSLAEDFANLWVTWSSTWTVAALREWSKEPLAPRANGLRWSWDSSTEDAEEARARPGFNSSKHAYTRAKMCEEILATVHPDRGTLAPPLEMLPDWLRGFLTADGNRDPRFGDQPYRQDWRDRFIDGGIDLDLAVKNWRDHHGDLLGGECNEGRLVWARADWQVRGLRGEAPEHVWQFFPHLRFVPEAVFNSPPAATLNPVEDVRQLPFEIMRGDLLLGASAFVDDLTGFDWSAPHEDAYRISWWNDDADDRRSKVVQNADGAGIDFLALPEGVRPRDPKKVATELEAWIHEHGQWVHLLTELVDSRLRWVLPGSGIYTGRLEMAYNRAAVLSARTPKNYQSLLSHDKLAPYNISADTLKAWGIDLKATKQQIEDIAHGDSLTILETYAGRIAVLICEDLSRPELNLAALAHLAPTHVVVLVFDRELDGKIWEAKNAEKLVEATGASVLVVNNTGVARHLDKSDAGSSPAPKCAALWSERGKTKPPRLCFSRRPTDVMVPQYGHWGSPIEGEDLEPGDVLFFMRPASADPNLGNLNELIANLDDTHLVHAAVVIDPSDKTGCTTIADSYDKVLADRHLSELKLYYGAHAHGTAPLFVSRFVDKRARCALPRAMVKLAKRKSEYPLADMVLASLALRARQSGVEESKLNGFIHALSKRSIAIAGKNPGYMCAAYVVQACADAGLDLGGQAVQSRTSALRRFGRLWLNDRSVNGSLLSAGLNESLTNWIDKNIGQVSKHVPYPPASYPLVGCPIDAVDWATGKSNGSSTLAAFFAWMCTPPTIDERIEWIEALEPVELRADLPPRLATVRYLANAVNLEPLGHAHQWWAT